MSETRKIVVSKEVFDQILERCTAAGEALGLGVDVLPSELCKVALLTPRKYQDLLKNTPFRVLDPAQRAAAEKEAEREGRRAEKEASKQAQFRIQDLARLTRAYNKVAPRWFNAQRNIDTYEVLPGYELLIEDFMSQQKEVEAHASWRYVKKYSQALDVDALRPGKLPAESFAEFCQSEGLVPI